MSKQEEKLELTDAIYDALVDEYKKVIVVGVDEDSYVVRYPNKIEWKAITKYGRDSLGKVMPSEKSQGLIEETVKGLIVWPEQEVFTEREEYDGGLLTSITNTFIGAYGNRTEEKKR